MLALFRRHSAPEPPGPNSGRATTRLRQRVRDYLLGAGTIVDPLPRADAAAPTFRTSDRDALAADWRAIGNDMRQAMRSALDAPSPSTELSHDTATQPNARPQPGPDHRTHRHGAMDAL